MGNYNCCSDKNDNKKTVRMKSIRTTTSIGYQSDILERKNLVSEFTDNFTQALEFLQRTRTHFQLNPQCFNVTLESKIGKGAHSDVYLIRTDYQTNFMEMALKIIPKQKVKSDSLRKSSAMENLLLLHNSCPFLMKSYMSRQDQNNLYLFCPIAPGGDLASFTEECSGKGAEFQKSEEENIRFILAGIILGLEYLHKIGIIMNDLKLENILIDKDGYPVITDFGLVEPENIDFFDEIVGTITYFSPEKLFSPQYTRSVDFWALGVLIYTLVYRQYPFDRQIIECGNFLAESKAKQNKHKKISAKGSNQLKDLINCLLIQDPSERLGYNSIQDLKKHSFFNGIDWQQYQNKTTKSPLKSIIAKYPLKGCNEQITTSTVKIFRPCSLEDEYLIPLESTMKLKKSMCSTADRISAPGSSQYIPQGPLHKTCTSYSPKTVEKRRKKSVSFELGI